MNKNIIFRFYKSENLISKIIRKITFGKYSHVSIQLDNVVYQALPFKGVFRQYTEDEGVCQATVVVEITERQFWNLRCHLNDEIGTGYDYGNIFRFLFFANYKKNNRWYCSELADMALGMIYPNSVDEKLISPSEFYTKIKSFVDGINYTKPKTTNAEINYDKIYPTSVYNGFKYD